MIFPAPALAITLFCFNLLRDAVKGEGAPKRPLGSRLRQRFASIGLEDDLPELRGEGAAGDLPRAVPASR